jgi:hypothetical protein
MEVARWRTARGTGEFTNMSRQCLIMFSNQQSASFRVTVMRLYVKAGAITTRSKASSMSI